MIDENEIDETSDDHDPRSLAAMRGVFMAVYSLSGAKKENREHGV